MEKISAELLTFLLNATWQVALVAAVASLAAGLLRAAPTRNRHGVWVAALLLAIALPLMNSARLLPVSASPASPTGAAGPDRTGPQTFDAAPSGGHADVAVPAPLQAAPARRTFAIPARFAAVLMGLYLAFVLLRVGGLVRAWLLTRAIVRRSVPGEFSVAAQRIVTRCLRETGVREVRFLVSRSVAAPLTVGFAPAVVVLPEKLLRENDEALLTSAIGHELVHVGRRDYVFNFLYRLLFIPLSFHPAAALIKRRIDQTRELRCDEVVTDRLLSPAAYARSLVELARAAHAFQRAATTVAVGIADADILEERIMYMLRKRRLSSAQHTFLLLTAALVFAVPCIAAAPHAINLTIYPAASSGSPAQQTERVPPASTASTTVAVNGENVGVAYTANGQEPSPQESQARMKRKLAEAKITAEEVRQLLEKQLAEGQFTPEQTVLLKRKLEDMSLREREMTPQELEARAKAEHEKLAIRAHNLSELSKAAKITMQQAIDAALRQQFGTVMESALVGEGTFKLRSADGSVSAGTFATSDAPAIKPMYRIVILFGDDTNPQRAVVLVSAVDGTIVRSVVE